MNIIINFADERFKIQQRYNTKTAYKSGKADLVIEYSPHDFDFDFKTKYKSILSQQKGCGYWLWKPYIILKTLEKVNEGDYIIYCDSGAFFVDNVDKLIKTMKMHDDELMVFELPLIEKQWTKKEAFLLMNCNKEKYLETNQIMATYFVLRKSTYTLDFVKKFFDYCQDERILTDVLNKDKQDTCFIEHRHDQSVFSLLCKKEGIGPYRDPSQYGDRPWEYATYERLIKYKEYLNSDYPRIIMSQRKARLRIFIVKEKIKDLVFKFGLIKYKKN